MSGRLFIIATPIGNLNDLSLRTKEALDEAEIILAEDTRVTIKLLNHLELKKKMYSCHEFNQWQRLSLLEDAADRDGTVALVSDAGTPLVSDPGYEIVQKAIDLGMKIVPTAGPSAFLLALIGSGLPCNRFAFEGFLPEKSGERKKRLEALQSEERTMLFYIAPHDFNRTVDELLATLGDRPACLARELTKLYEEFVRETLSELRDRSAREKPRGECVLVVGGSQFVEQTKPDRDYVLKALASLLDHGEGLKDASAMIAEETGWSKSDLYKLGINYIQSSKSQD